MGRGRNEPGTALLAALADAGPDGVPVAELLALSGITRPTLYRHLRMHADAGRAVQVSRGYWRATGPRTGRPAMLSRPVGPAGHGGPDSIPAGTGRGRQAVTDSDRNHSHCRLAPRARLHALGITHRRDETRRDDETTTGPSHRSRPGRSGPPQVHERR